MVLKKKLANDGTIAKYKACLVLRLYSGQLGGLFTYSCLCHYAMIRILLALASIEKWVIHRMNVKTSS